VCCSRLVEKCIVFSGSGALNLLLEHVFEHILKKSKSVQQTCVAACRSVLQCDVVSRVSRRRDI